MLINSETQLLSLSSLHNCSSIRSIVSSSERYQYYEHFAVILSTRTWQNNRAEDESFNQLRYGEAQKKKFQLPKGMQNKWLSSLSNTTNARQSQINIGAPTPQTLDGNASPEIFGISPTQRQAVSKSCDCTSISTTP